MLFPSLPASIMAKGRLRLVLLLMVVQLCDLSSRSTLAEVIQEFEISEGVPVGTSIGFIGKPVAGSSHPPPPPPYLIVPVPGSSVDSDLTIDQSNGEILTRIQLDRETRDSYSLVAIPMSGENIRVIIRVKDENDHAPEFPSTFMHVEFPENTPRDVKRTLQPARDKDLGIFNTQRYTISAGNVNSAFRLSSHRERDGVLYLDLQVNGFLDRETIPSYSLLIDAFDGGVPPLKGSMTINITITDQNDNAPIWQFPRSSNPDTFGGGNDITINQSRYFATVPENATVGTSVLQVFATDIDEGANGEVAYSINRRQTDKDAVFKIDHTTGIIYVNGPLDFETKEVYELVVVARDNGIQPLETTVFVTIRVLDLNDNQMEITVSFFSGESEDSPPKVSEKAQAGEFVARISVIDPDTKQDYNNVSISIQGDDGYFALQTVNSAVYLVVGNKKLDREKKSTFALTIVSKDKGNPYLNASSRVILQVEDENDNPPVFQVDEYHASVPESALPGTAVLQVKARDEDLGENSRVTYRLLHDSPSASSNWFEVDRFSGVISTRAQVDCEKDPKPRLLLVAEDHGRPALSGSAVVLVHLIDTNDTPIFQKTFYNATISENAPYGTCLLQVSASDPDCGINAELSYSLVNDKSSSEIPFSVNPKSGEICASASLDYETKNFYQLLVTVTDAGGLSSTTVVNIEVLDENDNVPVFYSPSFSVSIKEGILYKEPIVRVGARDADSRSYGEIAYSFLDGPDNGLFSINLRTGNIHLVRPLTASKSLYRLKVVAKDGESASDQPVDVTVHVSRSKSQAPMFQKPRYEFSISEDLGLKSPVGIVNAAGKGRIRYSIGSGNEKEHFSIHQYTGSITLARKVNFEERQTFLLTVVAQVEQHEVIGFCQVEIKVTDINDHEPRFENNEVKLWLPETVELGSTIYIAHAIDKDHGKNGELRYSLYENNQGILKLDKNSGVVTLQKALDYEATKTFSAVLGCYDKGFPQKSAQNLTLDIEVQDSNDNSPLWFKNVYEFWVKDRTPANTIIGKIGHEQERRTFGGIRFEMSDSQFRINSETGAISSKTILVKNSSVHRFDVTAYNQHLTGSKVKFAVVVHVTDKRQLPADEGVMRSNGLMQYFVNVTENTAPGSEILQILALDEDAGNNARITYKIVDSPLEDVVGIYSSSGIVFLQSPLDREIRDEYFIKVEAVDHGVPPLSSTATIHLTVQDENDNAPKFEKDVFKFTIQENNEPGTSIGQVNAHDRDIGKNSAIRYFLQPEHPDFSIDEFSGTISATSSLDREKQELYELQVVAVDEGYPPQESSALIQISLLDDNDNDPQILEPEDDFIIMQEQLPVGTQVALVVAEDSDVGDNARISYFLVNDGFSTSDEFEIEEDTGILKTSRVLYRSKKTFHTLRVKARDHGSPKREFIREYRVEVLSVDDKRLDALFVPSKLKFRVSEDAAIGNTIGKISVDQSLKEKYQVLYKLVDSHLNNFEVHPTSGDIIVAQFLNYENFSHYEFKVQAVLQTMTNVKSATVSVEINVIDVNDDRPKFPQDPIMFFVSENTEIGESVWNFTAMDEDSTRNGVVHYSIVSQKPELKFRLNVLTGSLYLQHALDFETCSEYVLIIAATDQGSNVDKRLNSTVTVNIKVKDENDNFPVFVSPSLIEVYALEPLKTVFHTVIAEDNDSKEFGVVSYEILSGNDEGIFDLNQGNGRLSLSKALKRNVEKYTLNISAYDHGVPSNVVTQVLSIVVKADQNYSPRFQSVKYEAEILENSSIGTRVTKISALKGDLYKNSTIKYIIPEGIGDEKFNINPTSGVITVAKPLDREEKSHYTLIVYIQDENQLYVFDTTTVTVNVLDTNDNAPNFHDSCTDLTVPENNELGVIHVFTAEDPDVGKNGEVTFAIGSGNVGNMFAVELHSGKLSGRPLDRERRSSYNLLIVAQDQGVPPKKSTCNVTIFVDDENDSPIIFSSPKALNNERISDGVSSPEFDISPAGQAVYKVSVAENVPIGTVVLRVQASDADVGINSVIKYSLNNESHWHFMIDNATGAIITAGPLDRETISTYMFEVAATDGGLYDSRTSTASVILTVTDINDNRPRFKENPVVAKGSAHSKPGQNLVQVSAVDPDIGPNAEITYLLEDTQKFNINSLTGQIAPVTSLASDRGKIFHLKVIAKDQGKPSLSSTALVVIVVDDANPRNALKFTESHYMAEIQENSSKGSSVLTVAAARNDGRRAKINFSIVSGNEDQAFEIDQTSGLIRTNNPSKLDKEISDEFNLVVTASVENNPSQVAHTTVKIKLLDMNDNHPRFTQPSYIASVWEGNTKGTFVTQVTATDADEGSNANVVYHIIDGNRDNAFVIEPPFSGIVKTNIVLDREILDEYRLTIIATDEGYPQMTGTCYLHVNVIDIQDQSPVFPPHSVISVKEDSPIGTLITTVVANDVDTNPALVYGFAEDGNANNIFSIGKYSGRVTLIKALDYETTKSYTARIQVSDSVHTAFTTLTVNVLDANDHRPIFSSSVYRIIVSEGTKVGTSVSQVNATDLDELENGEVKYALKIPSGKKSSSSFLSIDENTGQIFLNSSATYNPENPFSQLVVVATDNGNPRLSSESTLWIEVRPSQSHILKFSQNKYRVKVKQNAKSGSVVTQLAVERTDKINKGLHFHYSIVSGNEEDYFSINSHDGKVLLAKPLQNNADATYHLMISADCINMEQCSSFTELIIDAVGETNMGPHFDKSVYKVVVSEGKAVGSTLVKLHASDANSNSSVLYDITSGDDENFVEINQKTGLVVLKKPLDYDSIDSLKFIVRAYDSESPGGSWNFTTVQVNIEDDNDNEPRFLFSNYIGAVAENEPMGTTVCTVKAADFDKGIYGKLQYSILDGDGKDKFSIASSTGVVTTNAVFDYELKSRYYVTIRANDIGGKSSTAKLQIEIKSRDEFAPQFMQRTYRFQVPLNAAPGHVIGRVEALDEDRGPDGFLQYQFVKPSANFIMNKTTGYVILNTSPSESINATLTVMASTGRPGSKSATAVIEAVLGEALKELEMAASSTADWILGVLIGTLLLLILICVIFLLIHRRNKKQSKKDKSEAFSSPTFDTLDYAPPTMRISSTKQDSLYGSHYGNMMDLRTNDRRRLNNTMSELSDQSNSASSGRGSAEDGEEVEDEEICMINEGLQLNKQLCGLAENEDDNGSDTSAKNTQEYLARLGIRPNLASDAGQQQQQSGGLEWGSQGQDNSHLYEDKDISALIYSQINEDLSHQGDAKSNNTYNNVSQSSVTGSLSSIGQNEDELAGNYNWDYLLDWGPQYQPLAHVFSEIAHLKDGSSRSEPPYGALMTHNISSNNSDKGSGSVQKFSRQPNNMTTRTGPLPPLPVLPRSPIPNDINFSAGPISPSFSPALSPLANRSPSISPLGNVTSSSIRSSKIHDTYRSDTDLRL